MRFGAKRLALATLACLAIIAIVFAFRSESACRRVTTNASAITIDVSGLAQGRARRYCYADAAKQVRFVLARASDGKVRTVVDACRQCFVYHQGYRIVGHSLICRVCGNRYPFRHMTKGEASCVPIALPSSHKAGQLTIKIADLRRALQYF